MVAAIKSPTPYQFNECRVWPRQRSPIPRSHIQLKSTNCWRVCQKAISLQHHFQRVCQRLSRPSTSSLVSMPKGFLTLAQLAGECAQGLSRTSIIVCQVCPRAILLQHQLLASMPKGYLAPAPIAGEYARRAISHQHHRWRVCPRAISLQHHRWRVCPTAVSLQQHLLTSMHEGYLAPAPIAGEYARGLSRSSIICWRVCPRAVSLQRRLLASMPEGCLARASLAGEYA